MIFLQKTGQFPAGPACVLLALTCLLPGCGPTPARTDMPDAEKHILEVAALYNEYRSAKGRVPSNTAELKSWVKSLPKDRLTKMGIEDVDKAFISPRDNEPYVLVNPKVVSQAPMGMARVVVHEKTGVNGKRLTASLMGGGTQEMTEEEMQQAMTPRRMGP